MISKPRRPPQLLRRSAGDESSLRIRKYFQIDEEALAKRTAYLKQQRDKLLAMKKAEREKQLSDAEASQGKARPKVGKIFQVRIEFENNSQSARAARSALGAQGRKKIDPKTLEIRKALAEKLKQEVIDES